MRARVWLWPLAVIVGAVIGVAVAQAAPGPLTGFLPNLAEWYASPFALAGIIAIVVQFLKEHVLRGLEGSAVIAVSLALGGVLGVIGVWAELLAGSWIEGAAFGVVSGLIASGGYDLIKALFERWGMVVPAPASGAVSVNVAGESMAAPAAAVTDGATGLLMTARDFIFAFLRNRFAPAELPAAISAVAPLLAEFAQSDMILTDDRRSELQARLMTLLRRAGLQGVDL